MRGLSLILCFFLSWAACAQNVMNEDERFQFAEGLFTRGMYDLALKEYDLFLKDFPAAAKADVAHFRLGECQRQLGNRSGAEK